MIDGRDFRDGFDRLQRQARGADMDARELESLRDQVGRLDASKQQLIRALVWVVTRPGVQDVLPNEVKLAALDAIEANCD